MKRVFLLALIFAILTGVAVFLFASNLQQSSQGDTVAVVVAARQIPQRTQITSDMVEIRKLPAEAVNPKAMTDINRVVGRITNTSIEADEQVLSTKISEREIGDAGLSYTIPDGKRAISIEVSDTSGIAGYLQAGDHVDIIGVTSVDSLDAGATGSTTISKMVLQNIQVLVVSTKTLNESNDAAGYSIVTLAVTPTEATKLFYMIVNGRTTLVLRNDQDSDFVEVPVYYDAAQ